MKDIIKIVKSLEDSGLLLKGVIETVQIEVKKQKGGFISMLLGTLGATLLRNFLPGRGMNRASKGLGINRADEKFWELVTEIKTIKWIFNTASSFN